MNGDDLGKKPGMMEISLIVEQMSMEQLRAMLAWLKEKNLLFSTLAYQRNDQGNITGALRAVNGVEVPYFAKPTNGGKNGSH